MKQSVIIQENFENKKNKKEKKMDKKNDEKEDDTSSSTEKDMLKRLKEEYKKKQKSMELDDYKNIELIENMRDIGRIPNTDINSLKKSMEKSFSSVNKKLDKIKKNTQMMFGDDDDKEDNDDNDDKDDNEDNDEDEKDNDEEDIYKTVNKKENFKYEGMKNEKIKKDKKEEDDDEEDDDDDDDEDDDDEDDEEDEEKEDEEKEDEEKEDEEKEDEEKDKKEEEEDGKKESFELIEGNSRRKKHDKTKNKSKPVKFNKKKTHNKTNKTNNNKNKKNNKNNKNIFFKDIGNFFRNLISETTYVNNAVAEKICYVVSFGENPSKKDKTFIKNAWFNFSGLFITFFIFINWFYVIYFEKLTEKIISPDINFSYMKFSDNMPGYFLFKFFLEVPIHILDFLKDNLIYLIKTLPFDWGIGLEIIIPFFLYFVYYVSKGINVNIISYIENLLEGKSLSKTLMSLILLFVLIFILIKIPEVFLNATMVFTSPIFGSIATLVWFILKFLVSIPISVLFVAWFCVYYSFFVVLFQPIKELGVWGTFGEIFEKLNTFNPIYLKAFHDKFCVSSSDNCKEQGFLGFLYNQLLVPLGVFLVRHLFSYLAVFFLLLTIITAFYSIQSFTLKTNIIGLFGVISCAIILLSKWSQKMIIDFPTSENKEDNKSINVGYGPFIGAINLLLLMLYRSTYKLFSTEMIFITNFILASLVIFHFIYLISMNNHINLGQLPLIMYILLAASLLSYFHYDTFFNTKLGKIVMSLGLLVGFLSLLY
jgi:hypothetical protein